MIETNLPAFLGDLKETVGMFINAEDLNIRHEFKENGGKFVNTVIIDGKTYAFGNYVGELKGETLKKRIVKRYAKLSLYKALSKFLGVELPWGALTGVRPTKLAYDEINAGRDFTELFKETMLVSDKKTELIARIIENQRGIYEKREGNTDFFVFIPFCPSRCEYCSFITADIKSAQKRVTEYVDALICEIEESAKLVKNLRSIYVGGGTPVSLPNELLEKVLTAIEKIGKCAEFTVEAGRPDAINKENLDILKKHGVTRICINPQTFNDQTLKRIGRNHTADDIFKAYELAKNDFSVNMDLIAGLFGESFSDFKYSLDKAISLSPDDITVHTISVKRGSRLFESEKRVSVSDIEEMIDYAHETLYKNGYEPYYLYRQKYMAGNLENTGYAKNKKFCIYNVDVMEEIADNVACGAGAVSKKVDYYGEKIVRYGNPKDVPTYIEKIGRINSEKAVIFD